MASNRGDENRLNTFLDIFRVTEKIAIYIGRMDLLDLSKPFDCIKYVIIKLRIEFDRHLNSKSC